MRYPRFIALAASFWLLASTEVRAQIPLNLNPSRVLGQRLLPLSTVNPNLVEGRELYSPQSVAVDTSVSPPALFVSDTGNNRVLLWRNASQFANGAPADLIIGQKDAFTTFAQGPATAFSVGLSSPTGLAVRDGNLYVADCGNNRILRFPKPASTTGEQFPDMVIGQPNFNTRTANQGSSAPSSKTLALGVSGSVFRTSMTFDANGNLWVTDAGNNRLLRYSSAALSNGTNGPDADMVIGQLDFSTVAAALTASTGMQAKDRLQTPAGVALDGAGRLYASDGLGRVLVFAPPFFSGMTARRILGVVIQPAQGQTPLTQPVLDRTLMIDPEGLLMVSGNIPAVVDAASHRILLFDPYEQWPDEATTYSPMARTVIGQGNDFSIRKANNGQPEPSPSTLSSPIAAALANNELFVADSGNHRVVVLPYEAATFGPATRVLGQNDFAFGSANLIEGREFDFSIQSSRGLAGAAAMAVDAKSDPPRLYVADVFNNRVLGFADARKVRPGDTADIVIGQPDMFRAVCNYPNGDVNKPTQSSLCFSRVLQNGNVLATGAALAVDDDGNLYVADGGNGRVLRFPTPFRRQGTLPQADLVLGQISFTSSIFDPSEKTMSVPAGLALVANQGLVVSDQAHNRVLFFPKTNGEFSNGIAATKVIGQPNFRSTETAATTTPEDNRLNGPQQLAADTDGRIYVTDAGNNRVMIFDTIAYAPATDARAVMMLTDGPRSPRGIYVNQRTGEIWVTDTQGGRALRYPAFDQLPITQYTANLVIPGPANPLAVVQDQFGDLFIADTANRIVIHYPGLNVVNGASFAANRPLAPGMLATAYPVGTKFGDQTQSNTDLANPTPLPTELGDIQVLMNDAAVPLYYVAPDQINFVVPNKAPASGTAELTVVRKVLGADSGQQHGADERGLPGADDGEQHGQGAGDGQERRRLDQLPHQSGGTRDGDLDLRHGDRRSGGSASGRRAGAGSHADGGDAAGVHRALLRGRQPVRIQGGFVLGAGAGAGGSLADRCGSTHAVGAGECALGGGDLPQYPEQPGDDRDQAVGGRGQVRR